jgi:hypothetical protein
MNILSIGNSFSTNAHKFLSQIAADDGEEIMLCNLFIGGCSLEQHWNNWREEKTVYDYEIYLPDETEMTSPLLNTDPFSDRIYKISIFSCQLAEPGSLFWCFSVRSL